jgi:SPP1 gp7 family putative phage head morphogenesis protein
MDAVKAALALERMAEILSAGLLNYAPTVKAVSVPIERGLTPEAKASMWTKADRLATSWEGKFSKAATQAIEHDKRELLALLNEAKHKSLEAKATVDWQDYLLKATDYLSSAGDENWRKTFLPVVRGIITARGESLNADFGMQFDVRNLFAEQWFDDYMLKFAQPINKTTSDDVSRLQQTAMEQGWSIPDMQKALGVLFDQYLTGGGLTDEERQWFQDRTPAYRTENIARTETMRASNAGSTALFQDWGVGQKEWLATKDNRTRPEHWAANGQVVGIDESFDVGGEKLEYPGDPSGDPANTCQCRCTVLPVMG